MGLFRSPEECYSNEDCREGEGCQGVEAVDAPYDRGVFGAVDEMEHSIMYSQVRMVDAWDEEVNARYDPKYSDCGCQVK